MAADFATPKGQGRNPYNPSILSDGSVDPKSSSYQRSVAGREKLKPYLQNLWDQGKDERDVFMAGVKALTSRSKGYVGAYLDSKNPGRTYTDNQAKAITDQVMTDAGIGDHPGARLTKPGNEDERDKRKEARDKRKTASKYGPQMAPAKSAKSVRQQRKEGKREGVGMPETWAPEGTGGVGASSPVEKPAKQPTEEKGGKAEPSPWQNVLKDRMEGKASTKDVVEAFRKEKQSPIKVEKKAQPKGEKVPTEAQAPEPEMDNEPEEEEIKLPMDGPSLGSEFRKQLKEDMKIAGKRTGNELSHMGDLVNNDPDLLIDLLKESVKELEKKGYVREGDMQNLADQINRRFAKYLNGFKFEGDDFGKPEEGAGAKAPEGGGETPQEEAGAKAPEKEAEAPQEEAGAQPPEPEKKPSPSAEDITNLFRKKYNDTKAQLQNREKELARKERRVARPVQISPDDLDYLLTETVEDLSQDWDVNEDMAKKAVSQKFGVKFPGQEEDQTPQEKAGPQAPEPNPWDEEYKGPTKDLTKSQPSAPKPQAALPPASSPRAVSSKGGLKAPASPRARKTVTGFTPGDVKSVVRKASAQSSTPEEFKSQVLNQLDLLGGRGYETGNAQTNPLEGGSTPSQPAEQTSAPQQPTPGQQELFRKGTISPRTGKGFGSNRFKNANLPLTAPEPITNPWEEPYTGEIRNPAETPEATPSPQPLLEGQKPPAGLLKPGQEPIANPWDQPYEGPVREPGRAPAQSPPPQPLLPAAKPTGSKTRQMPLNLGRENTQAKLAARKAVEDRRLAKEAKKLPKPPARKKSRKAAPPKQGNLFSTSEYQQFADSIRSMMR